MFKEQKCVNNKHILCEDSSRCFGCGWDPQEEERRKSAIRSGRMRLDLDGLRRLHTRDLDKPEQA